jgi:hypothetical protein
MVRLINMAHILEYIFLIAILFPSTAGGGSKASTSGKAGR